MVCAGIGTQYFANVKYGNNLNRQVNFSDFSHSFLFLFQVMTGMQALSHSLIFVSVCPRTPFLPDVKSILSITGRSALGYISGPTAHKGNNMVEDTVALLARPLVQHS